jgi:hypothetical protein
MSDRSGHGLILAGIILTVIGSCIVLIKVWHVPAYWVPLMVGLGLIIMGLVRRMASGDSRDDRR